MHGGFCDQPRPGNDPGDDPVSVSFTVRSGDTVYTAITVRRPDALSGVTIR